MIYTLVSFGIDKQKELKLVEYFDNTTIRYKNIIVETEFINFLEYSNNIIVLISIQLNIETYNKLLNLKEKKNVIYIYTKCTLSKEILYSFGADILIDQDFSEYELHKNYLLSYEVLSNCSRTKINTFDNLHILGNKYLYINMQTLDCYCNFEIISLSKNEYKVLFALIESENKVVSRNELLSRLNLDSSQERYVDTIIKCLRKKLGKETISVMRCHGYLIKTT